MHDRLLFRAYTSCMSKIQLFGVSVAGILVLVGGFLFMRGNTGLLQEKGKQSSILLYVRSGDVSYKPENGSSFQKATTSPIAIDNKSYVYTGIGAATILLPDNSSIDLDRYTELQVTYDEKGTSISQTLGTTYHRVQALISGKTYEVSTPGTLAAVRGTRFAVKYDKKTKITKIAVTEHAVSVAKIDSTGTTTKPITVEEGKMAKVDEKQPESAPITVAETASDQEMKTWVEENKARDEKIDSLDKTDLREKMEDLLTNTTNDADTKGDTGADKKTDLTQPEKKTEATDSIKKTETTAPTETTQEKAKSDASSQQDSVTVKKLDEETFFTQFDDLFSQYFYLDEKDTPCSVALSPEERVKKVSTFASTSGYPFSSNTLLSFAQAVDAYCQNKNPDTKTKLQARFDAEYPFNE